MDHRDFKDHEYPKDTKGDKLKKADKDAHGGESKTTNKGDHLTQGEGTSYNQMAVPDGFVTHDARPGHKQEKNIDESKGFTPSDIADAMED